MRAHARVRQLLKHITFWQPPTASSVEEKLSDHPIPFLKTLDLLVELFKKALPNMHKIAIIAVQHNLETTATLYRALQQLGIQKIYSLGKCYSDAESVIQSMKKMGIKVRAGSKPKELGKYQEIVQHDIHSLWQFCLDDIENSKIDTLIVLDDGGRLLTNISTRALQHYKVVGIEQTRGGLYLSKLKTLPFPIIDVASSAIKRWVEPPFIVKAVLSKVSTILKKQGLLLPNGKPNPKSIMGIIGLGAIGAAIASYLVELGYQVYSYDKDEQAVQKARLHGTYRMDTIKNLIANSNCIFSCTGEDVTQDLSLRELVESDTLFISCSSEDKEFRDELRRIAEKSILHIDEPLSTFTVKSSNQSKITFFRGGFPGNFDNLPWNVPADEIEVTQAALLSAVIQAVLSAKKIAKDGITINAPVGVMLNPAFQTFILEERCKNGNAKSHEYKLLDNFRNKEWIISESGKNNIHQPNQLIEESISAPRRNNSPLIKCRL